jgi:hypothetical protein
LRIQPHNLNLWQLAAAAGFAAVVVIDWIVCNRLSAAHAAALCACLSVCSGLFWAFAAALSPRRRRLAQALNFLAACWAAAAGIGLLR